MLSIFYHRRRRRKSKRLGALYKISKAARCHDYCAFTSGNMLC
ncbi:hypothetical protein A628_03541 [Salmonella enterica subsp. enterica serovar Cubana str. 76814]|uniref:Uncharacterized protein n=1 Tax=Salmonella enterica subsp. enterica serovar Cubana str. 76814 TaxID=1192560 RepID=V7IMC4_SALET|nr:hypothetical protein A628_03541 [Salmonella enterica subsp. enterica serovar Cubana str. 76814]